MASPAYRPILKRSVSSPKPGYPSPPQSQVHFPPSPTMSRVYSALSPSIYDRSPIVVGPNTCALPERGCPGRTYTIDESASASSSSSYGASIRRSGTPHNAGRHLHPNATNFASSQRNVYDQRNYSMPPPPPLVPDLSSESDESDGFIPPPPMDSRSSVYPSHHLRQQYPDHYHHHYSTQVDVAYREQNDYIYTPPPIHSGEEKSPRRRREPRPRMEHSREREPEEEEDHLPSNKSSPKRRSSAHRTAALCKTVSSFSFSDDAGCLDGF